MHRQVEKPWIYAPRDDDKFEKEEREAQHRWTAVSSRYVDEAEMRGRNRLGDLPPSAEFLMALATLDLPARLRDASGLAIIDVVITAGKGACDIPASARSKSILTTGSTTY